MAPVAQLASLILGIVVLPLGTILLAVAVTWEGRAFAAAMLALTTALAVVSFGRDSTRRRRVPVGLGLSGFAVLLLAVVAWRAPSGAPPRSARVHHLYADGESHARWTLAALVPEIDQLRTAFVVMPLVDPLSTQRQAAPLRRWTTEIYRELDADPEFRALGSVMNLAYADFRGAEARQHAFLYIPRTLDRSRPAPAILFFHGSGGNFKAYLWLLAKVADALNCVVIAPSGGLGRWTADETRTRVAAAFAAAQRILPLDTANIHAVGLSNGGLALSHVLASGRDYRSSVFLSPVFHDEAVRGLRFKSGAKMPAVLILTGALDNRVPLSYVEDRAGWLKHAGAQVTVEAVPHANHFLFFSHQQQTLTRLKAWVDATAPGVHVHY